MAQQQGAFGGLGLRGLQGLQQARQAPLPDFSTWAQFQPPRREAKPVDVSLREELQQETDKALEDVLK